MKNLIENSRENSYVKRIAEVAQPTSAKNLEIVGIREEVDKTVRGGNLS